MPPRSERTLHGRGTMYFDAQLLGHDLVDWLWAGGIFISVFAGLLIFTRLVARKLSALAENSTTVLDDGLASALQNTRLLFMLAAAAWAASRKFDLGDAGAIVDPAFTILLFLQIALWLTHLVRYSRERYTELHLSDRPETVTTLSAVTFVMRIAIWSLFFILVLDNLGFNVTALLAGLGVGGIAVALALQNILSDLFASLSIAIDKPFVVGDLLVMGDYVGNVEYIGLKSTRLRSLSGEQIVMSNSELLKTRIRNYQRMQERRVVMSVGVVYGTSADDLEAVPSMVEDIIREQEHARFDRAHFKQFGAYSLDFEVVYYVLDRDYATYMDVQQRINMAVYRAFEQRGIEFAYPTQTLLLGRPEAATASRAAA
jgi:small-conductance mechanosensitive channel